VPKFGHWTVESSSRWWRKRDCRGSMTISSSYAAFHSLSVSRPITCPRLPTSSKWSVDYLNPPPFVTYICVAGGGGGIEPCSGSRFTHFPARARTRISSPLISWISDCSVFPVVIAKKETIKEIFYIPRIIPKSAGNMNLIFLFPCGWTFRVIPPAKQERIGAQPWHK
jgi:hypothetical protein